MNKKLVFFIAIFLIIASTITPVMALDYPHKNDTPPPTTVTPGIERIYGENAYETSVKVAAALKEELKVSKFSSIIVATGTSYYDAISGSYLAANKKAPIILLKPNGNNPQAYNFIKSNIDKKGTIYILGGPMALSEDIERTLKSYANVERVYGANKYKTNLAILNKVKSSDRDILVCSANGFEDALSASSTGKQILLVGNSLTSAQKKWLKKNATSPMGKIYIIGGPVAVSEQVEEELKAYKTPVRVSGSNMYGTSTAVARHFFQHAQEATFTVGTHYADGLSVAPLAYVKGAPILLQNNNYRFATVYNYVYKSPSIKRGTIIGGPKLISNNATGLTEKGGKKAGFLKVGSYTFYSDKGTILKKKLFNASGKKYYAKDKGYIAKNELITVENKTYGATSDFSLAKNGLVKIGNAEYYFENYVLKGDRVFQNPKGFVQITQNISDHNQGYYISPIRVKKTSTREQHIDAMISRAYDYLGDPYVWCAAGKPGKSRGVDCMGLVMQAGYAAGFDLYPTTPYRMRTTTPYETRQVWPRTDIQTLPWSKRQRGDLVFYYNNEGNIYHVAIYLGNDKVIHAVRPEVTVSSAYGWGKIAGVKRPFYLG